VNYDEQYATVDAVFGTEVESTLKSFADRLKPGSEVLDIGAGQGRNGVFLAERGFTVHALEPSKVASTALGLLAGKRRLAMEIFSTTFEQFDPPVGKYAGILVFGLVPDLDWPSIRRLLTRIHEWSEQGSLIWVTGFTTQDPAYARHRACWETVGQNSFRGPEGQIRTYLEPGQIVTLFKGHSTLHCWEGLGPAHRHGGGPPERHGKFEAVLSKQAKPRP
jgi:tellurite methyltransferase